MPVPVFRRNSASGCSRNSSASNTIDKTLTKGLRVQVLGSISAAKSLKHTAVQSNARPEKMASAHACALRFHRPHFDERLSFAFQSQVFSPIRHLLCSSAASLEKNDASSNASNESAVVPAKCLSPFSRSRQNARTGIGALSCARLFCGIRRNALQFVHSARRLHS